MKYKLKKNFSLCAVALGVVVIFTAVTPALNVYAVSPTFARSDEEWATLADNHMDYAELEGLVEEYNATVQQNQINYIKFKSDYGRTNSEVSDSYRDIADDLIDAIDYPDTDDSDYASRMITILSNESTAKRLRSTADDNLEDSDIIYMNYELAEKTLVEIAQNNMISYHSGVLDIQKAQNDIKLMELNVNAEQAKLSVGTATQVDVLNAQESYTNAQQAQAKAESALENTKQKLCIMLGWSYDANPEIGDIPEPDMTRIDAMNPTIDKEAALANNYTLNVNKKKLANASAKSQQDTMNSTIADNESKIASSLVYAYNNVTAAKNSYIYAQSVAELQNTNLATAAQQYGLGTLSKLNYDQQQYTTQSANIVFKQASFTLFEAMESYDWAVAGLATAS